MISNSKILNSNQIETMSSDYIKNYKKYEEWKINDVIINDKTAIMYTSMTSIYPSKTDKLDFHLSMFMAEEMASQLITIYIHDWAKITKKSQEIWMIEGSKKCTSSIRSSKNIKIEMNIDKIKKRDDSILAICNFNITDDKNGLIEITQRVLLS